MGCAQGRCATGLRYAPTFAGLFILNHFPAFSKLRIRDFRFPFGQTVSKLYQNPFSLACLYQTSCPAHWPAGSTLAGPQQGFAGNSLLRYGDVEATEKHPKFLVNGRRLDQDPVL
jgi:hypothetical protein